MRTHFSIALLGLATLPALGEEAPATDMRQKLKAKVLASVPAAPAVEKTEETKEPDRAVVLMDRVTVTESNRSREIQTAVARESQKKIDEQFSITKGGTILKNDVGKVRIELADGGMRAHGNSCGFLGE